jgi:hypothetical protein
MSEAESWLGRADASLQRWYRDKPPPVYVSRQLERLETPEGRETWSALMAELFGEQSVSLEGLSSLRVSNNAGIARLNSIAYEVEYASAVEAEECARRAREALDVDSPPLLQARVHETLARAMAAAHVEWARLVMPAGKSLNPGAAQFQQTVAACQRAFESANALSHRPLQFRATRNLACTLDDLRIDPRATQDLLQMAFLRLLDLGRAEPAFDELYADLLDRIVRVGYSIDDESATKADAFRHFLKNFGLAKGIIKSAARRQAAITELVISMEGVREDGTALPLPLAYDYPAICARIPEGTEVVEYTVLDDRVQVHLLGRSGMRLRNVDPDASAKLGGGWDHFLRPGRFEFSSAIAAKDAFRERLPTALAVDVTHANVQQDSTGLAWEFAYRRHELQPLGSEKWCKRSTLHSVRLDQSVPWRKHLWNSLAGGLIDELDRRDARHVALIPDMALHHVPFHLLEGPRGCLGDLYRVSYLSNLASLAASLAVGPAPRQALSALIIRPPPGVLTHVDAEVRAIQAVLPDARVLRGDEANDQDLQSALESADVIHFATHGRFDSERPERSGLMLDNERWLALERLRELRLPGSLVVLSACDTGRVSVVSRQQTLGIAESLLFAGASTVVSTLWEAEEVSTVLLVSRFYSNLFHPAHPLTRLESLAEAARWLRKVRGEELRGALAPLGLGAANAQRSFDNPLYWANFVLYGQWQ